jgi:hypothetical protein
MTMTRRRDMHQRQYHADFKTQPLHTHVDHYPVDTGAADDVQRERRQPRSLPQVQVSARICSVVMPVSPRPRSRATGTTAGRAPPLREFHAADGDSV